MKTEIDIAHDTGSGKLKALGHVCLKCCQQVVAQVQKAKALILAEWQGQLSTNKRMLELTLNEAEALAWQTSYPHLLFPVLAAEKVQALARWNSHQREVHRVRPDLALSA
jgi:hypothetical protein